ncbi:unnamed protein product [Kluyveromyces dobzhanskii CBS 2104]|uniref:WGS project CCBQ000000000 data, contig 00012 n=1 Tax=Kluyveromyces dobzhanskii CBS 2104 TaxID=1427455 RepID=A0A0A8L380_9SACH|nr:unnamed protein product [Kluyveromyces dobzhanskii CBS 2104]
MWQEFQILLVLFIHLSAALQGTGDLYLLDHSNERHNLAILEISDEFGAKLDLIEDTIVHGKYRVCGTFQEYYDECFSFTEINHRLSHELELLVIGDKVVKMSLHWDGAIDGITPVIKEVGKGAVPESFKLRKRTMTYESKKKAERKNTGTAAFEEDLVEEKTFVQKNWKFIVLGVICYAFVSSGSK